MNFLQHRAAKAQQARKICTSPASGCRVSTLSRIDYIKIINQIYFSIAVLFSLLGLSHLANQPDKSSINV